MLRLKISHEAVGPEKIIKIRAVPASGSGAPVLVTALESENLDFQVFEVVREDSPQISLMLGTAEMIEEVGEGSSVIRSYHLRPTQFREDEAVVVTAMHRPLRDRTASFGGSLVLQVTSDSEKTVGGTRSVAGSLPRSWTAADRERTIGTLVIPPVVVRGRKKVLLTLETTMWCVPRFLRMSDDVFKIWEVKAGTTSLLCGSPAHPVPAVIAAEGIKLAWTGRSVAPGTLVTVLVENNGFDEVVEAEGVLECELYYECPDET